MVPETSTFAFWLCNNCVEACGPIAATMSVPDEIFWAKVAEEQKEKPARRLAGGEIIIKEI